jgi:predicted nucleotidyltransferase
MLNPLIKEKYEDLANLCERFHVRRMDLFGSAAEERFDRQTSDLDFLVAFEDLGPGEYVDAYFGLLEALQDLFRRPVDLVVASAVKNPYFLEEIEKTRMLLYAA